MADKEIKFKYSNLYSCNAFYKYLNELSCNNEELRLWCSIYSPNMNKYVFLRDRFLRLYNCEIIKKGEEEILIKEDNNSNKNNSNKIGKLLTILKGLGIENSHFFDFDKFIKMISIDQNDYIKYLKENWNYISKDSLKVLKSKDNTIQDNYRENLKSIIEKNDKNIIKNVSSFFTRRNYFFAINDKKMLISIILNYFV